MDVSTQLWLEAHARLVREVGRAVAHALRGHLNGIGLAVALTEQVAADLPASETILAQAVRTGRQETARAEAAAAHLQALVSDAFSPAGMRLDLAARWAAALVAPIADDRGVRVVQAVDTGPATVDDLPDAPSGGREALALWVLAAVRETARGGDVIVRVTAAAAAVHWTGRGDTAADVALARDFATIVPGLLLDVHVATDGACTARLRVT
jgi:hypothetical protein